MSVLTASRVAPGWYWRIVQGGCLLSLLTLGACDDGAFSNASRPDRSAHLAKAGHTATPGTSAGDRQLQWGLLPLNLLPRVDIAATSPKAGAVVMRHTKQDRYRPRKLTARLLPQKSPARLITAPRLTRQAAPAPAGSDTILAARATRKIKTPAPAARPRKKTTLAKAPSPKPAAPRSAAPRSAAPGAIASLVRPRAERLSTGSINRTETVSLPSPVKSYLKPNPRAQRYNLAILGDSLGVGIGLGMSRDFIRQGRLDVLKKAREGSGLTRPDFYDWDRALSRVVRNHRVDIAIVQIGANDGQSIRAAGRLRAFGTPAWRREYAKRVDAFITRLEREHAAIYWVEVPPMGRPKLNHQVKLINALIKQRVLRRGIKYVSTWNRFANRYGQYTAYDRSAGGGRVRIRARDGVHFTSAGYRLFAAHVESAINRDLAIARRARATKMAGAELSVTR